MQKQEVQFVDDGWWEADHVEFNYKGDKSVAKVFLSDDNGNKGTYLAQLKEHAVYPDDHADVYDPSEPTRINIDPSSDVFERMATYIHHKAIF